LVEWLRGLSGDKSNKNFDSDGYPRLLVMFDEAHSLAVKIPGANWTIFSELRRVIRRVKDGVFFFFLSTAGKTYQFTPPPGDDTSNRVQDGRLKLLEPFTKTGFNRLALCLDKDKEKNVQGKLQTDLEAVTSLRWQAHDSRAL
jgi:hypothetical protein